MSDENALSAGAPAKEMEAEVYGADGMPVASVGTPMTDEPPLPGAVMA